MSHTTQLIWHSELNMISPGWKDCHDELEQRHQAGHCCVFAPVLPPWTSRGIRAGVQESSEFPTESCWSVSACTERCSGCTIQSWRPAQIRTEEKERQISGLSPLEFVEFILVSAVYRVWLVTRHSLTSLFIWLKRNVYWYPRKPNKVGFFPSSFCIQLSFINFQ